MMNQNDMHSIGNIAFINSAYRKKFKHRKKINSQQQGLKINYYKILLIIILVAILIFIKPLRKIVFYIFFILITGYITYYSKLYHIPIDVSPLFFLEIVITRYYGIKYTLLFILLAYFGPKILAGHAANWMSYAFVGVSLMANLFVIFFPNMNLQTIGYITSVIQYIGGIFINMTLKPFYFAVADGIANVTNNLLYFLIFTDFIIMLF